MIPRFLLTAATLLLLTACAKDAAKPETAAEADADTAAVELHFHAISGLSYPLIHVLRRGLTDAVVRCALRRPG